MASRIAEGLALLALAALTGCPQEASPAGAPPTAPSGASQASAASPAKRAGRTQSEVEAGVRLVLPGGFRQEFVRAGVNRVIRVERNKKLVCAINSGPIYPWQSHEDLRAVIGNAEWQTGPIAPDLKVSLGGGGEVEAWASYQTGSTRTLALIQHGRTVRISARDWNDQVRSVLAGVTIVPGAEWRTSYRERLELSEEQCTAPPGDVAKRRIAAQLAFIGDDLEEFSTPLVRKGLALYRANKLDRLDAIILSDLLEPVRVKVDAERKSRPKGGETRDYDGHGGEDDDEPAKTGATPGPTSKPASRPANH